LPASGTFFTHTAWRQSGEISQADAHSFVKVSSTVQRAESTVAGAVGAIKITVNEIKANISNVFMLVFLQGRGCEFIAA